MPETEEAPKTTPKETELDKVNQLVNLKGAAATYTLEVNNKHHDWQIGNEVWEENGKDKVILEEKLKPLAGVYLALLGKAQLLPPEEAKRVPNIWQLQTREGRSFMDIASRYDNLVDQASNPGVLGRMAGRESVTQDEIMGMEEKIWEAFKKEESPPQPPTPSTAT